MSLTRRAPAQKSDGSPPAPLHILLVDDHAESLTALARLLRGVRGYEVREATTVAEALRLALAGPCDVLISDLDLTDGDGCELLCRIRAVHPNVRGIAVSGYVGKQYEQRCREAGYERLLSKPVLFDQVLAAIAA